MNKNLRKPRFGIPAIIALSLCAASASGETPYSENPGSSIEILGISVNPETRGVTLRWSSKAGSSYIIEETANPDDGWVRSLSEIEGEGTETTHTISSNQDQGRPRALFFRVREMNLLVLESTPERFARIDRDPASKDPSQLTATPLESKSRAVEKATQEISRKSIAPSRKKTETPSLKSSTYLPPDFFVG